LFQVPSSWFQVKKAYPDHYDDGLL